VSARVSYAVHWERGAETRGSQVRAIERPTIMSNDASIETIESVMTDRSALQAAQRTRRSHRNRCAARCVELEPKLE